MESNIVLDGLFGLCVGDALGVPVEFKSREYLDEHPVSGMVGGGTYEQPPGTWSDDSSLAFCLADSLCDGFDIQDIADKFVKWYNGELWTPHGEMFDVGTTTSRALLRLEEGVEPVEAGGRGEWSNGNGSLMRILPLAFYLKDNELSKRAPLIEDVSAITHGHKRSRIACVIYIEMAVNIIRGLDLEESYREMKKTIKDYYSEEVELDYFSRLLDGDIRELDREDIESSAYVLHTIEASFWCLLNSDAYSETVLKAVNLGEDTDTTGSVSGGLAGLYYGYNEIPEEWREEIARKEDIIDLCSRLYQTIS